PIWGMMTLVSAMICFLELVCVQLASHADNVRNLGQKELFQWRTIGHWSVRSRDAPNRTVQVFERFIRNNRGKFTGESADARVFVKKDDFIRFLHGLENRL